VQEAYPIRSCPECGRFLLHWKGEFACWSCWKKYKLEDTAPHPNPEGICRFVERPAEAGSYFICIDCGKTIFLTTEELKAYYERMDLFFSDEHIEKERKASEEWIASFARGVEKAQKISSTQTSIKDALKSWKLGDRIVFVDSSGKEIEV